MPADTTNTLKPRSTVTNLFAIRLQVTNDAINTNNCIISVCNSKYQDKLIILSVIDNLIKGGSGQAVQNMNIYYNFKENEGLNEKN